MTQRRMLLVRAPGERIAKRLEMKDPPQVTRRCQIKFRANLFRILKISHKNFWSFLIGQKIQFLENKFTCSEEFSSLFSIFSRLFLFYCAKLIFRFSTKTGFFALIKNQCSRLGDFSSLFLPILGNAPKWILLGRQSNQLRRRFGTDLSQNQGRNFQSGKFELLKKAIMVFMGWFIFEILIYKNNFLNDFLINNFFSRMIWLLDDAIFR